MNLHLEKDLFLGISYFKNGFTDLKNPGANFHTFSSAALVYL